MNTETTTRRALLLAAASSVTHAIPKPCQAARQQKSQAVRFGVRGPFPKAGIRERAQLLQRLGYDGIELGPEWLNQPADAILKELDGTGIRVSAIVGSIQLLHTDPRKRAEAIEIDRRRLEMAKQLRADAIIEVPVFGPNQFQDLSPVMTPREIEDKLLVAGLRQLVADVKRTGVTLLIEPLIRKETHYMNLQSHGAEIIRAVGAPGFKLLSDFYHMTAEEKDVAETLALVGNHTGYVHLADPVKRTEPGSLSYDYRPAFGSLKKWGYAGWLTVESGATDNPEAALARALSYLKQQWAEAPAR
jgi:sugar phosphate isomerase/epimerase